MDYRKKLADDIYRNHTSAFHDWILAYSRSGGLLSKLFAGEVLQGVGILDYFSPLQFFIGEENADIVFSFLEKKVNNLIEELEGWVLK